MSTQHQEVNVLWEGGWDTYIVDPESRCDTPKKEDSHYFPTWHDGPNSGSPRWLKCSFCPRHNFGEAHQSVKVIRRVASGN